MGALATVADYVTRARVLLLDEIAPYRYPDQDIVQGLNLAFLEARRLRPDLFIGLSSVPSYSANDATPVSLDEQYRVAFLYYACGHAQLRDAEDTQDSRAAAFFQMFSTRLLALVG